MKIGAPKKLFPLLVGLLLAACAGKSDTWPTLSEPLPDQSARTAPLKPKKPAGAKTDRTLASAHAEPAAPTRPTSDTAPKTAAEAEALLSSIKDDLRVDTLAYREAVAKIDDTVAENRLDAWYEAQAALTRLSQTASRLDALTGTSDDLALEGAKKAAQAQANVTEQFVVIERQRLAGLKPAPEPAEAEPKPDAPKPTPQQ